jgi:hypothetical protein
MFSGKFFLSVALIAVAVTLIQWFFTGFLFHKYQALTPSTWRKETSRSYTWSTMLAVFFAFMFAIAFSFWKGKFATMDILDGIEFGGFCALAFVIPYEIGTGIYVNYSNQFVIGRCLSSLIEYIVAGVIAVELL